MSITITGIPDCRAPLGPSQELRAYQLQPGANDYPTGGYPITAAQVGLSFLFGGFIIGVNAAGALYLAQFVFVAGAFGTTPQPEASVKLMVLESAGSQAAFVEVGNGTDLSGVRWFAEFLGY